MSLILFAVANTYIHMRKTKKNQKTNNKTSLGQKTIPIHKKMSRVVFSLVRWAKSTQQTKTKVRKEKQMYIAQKETCTGKSHARERMLEVLFDMCRQVCNVICVLLCDIPLLKNPLMRVLSQPIHKHSSPIQCKYTSRETTPFFDLQKNPMTRMFTFDKVDEI